MVIGKLVDPMLGSPPPEGRDGGVEGALGITAVDGSTPPPSIPPLKGEGRQTETAVS